MVRTSVNFAWRDSAPLRRLSTAVCLHGHTMHSEECLNFLPRYLRAIPGISLILDGYERGQPVEFHRSWWTPPLSPASALLLEQNQIAALGLRPLVSLTDHDNIDAGRSLQVAADPRQVPVSVEWTVPYERSILHIGVHNLPPASARSLMAALARHTATPEENALPSLLAELAGIPDVLLVLNHPFWLEEGVEEADHRKALRRLLRECIGCFHAFELNGTRPWKENAAVIELSRTHRLPLISGGDRHACEPAACLNLTNAATFAEFVCEIREGYSSICFMPQYREPMSLRVLEAARDILRPYPEYPKRERWTDRFFHRGQDGVVRSLATLWQDRVPWFVSAAAGIVRLPAASGLKPALRLLLAQRGEILP